MEKVLRYAFMNAFGTALYVFLIGSFLPLAGNYIAESAFVPVAMLMLLVFSVAVVGSLLFGRPAMWYVDGKKKDALALLSYTLGIFFVLTLVVLGIVAVVGM